MQTSTIQERVKSIQRSFRSITFCTYKIPEWRTPQQSSRSSITSITREVQLQETNAKYRSKTFQSTIHVSLAPRYKYIPGLRCWDKREEFWTVLKTPCLSTDNKTPVFITSRKSIIYRQSYYVRYPRLPTALRRCASSAKQNTTQHCQL